MIIVGEIKEIKKNSKNHSNKILYRYQDIHYDEDGWADCKKYLPVPYDLCFLKLKTGKILAGWRGSIDPWHSRLLKENDEVIAWKPCQKNESLDDQ